MIDIPATGSPKPIAPAIIPANKIIVAIMTATCFEVYFFVGKLFFIMAGVK